ncbi:hypothetical protein FE236_06705 [Mariprofundus erugo]|uniref:Metallo-beta-lactamase domain-containing protein n=1 Tax=Mariprofundus erugo TaxID=2528639 RepID=A0A5R9GT73_9PROT|nr:hypothetical protein [Mariprofundus erugo]TLS67282.1 hypothetical protein FEF65_07555 [Mariprofundus erugo]TLS76536.1 hypothetical protein FE236_06705 [Mariprofundus erugo]
MQSGQFEEAIRVADDIYWVGFSDEQAHLHCNPYLLIDGTGDELEAVLFDPGSLTDFPKVMRKVLELVNPARISLIVAHHQDPDVCSNIPVVEDIIGRNDLKVAAHTNSIRLIRHYGIQSAFYAVEDHDYAIRLKSGRVLEFMFTPYLHSPGAIVTYDTKTRSLFTSDIFGAVSGNWDLFARDDSFLPRMDSFHQLYMPSNRVLNHSLCRMQKRWQIDRILPQHGSVIEGALVPRAFEHLKALPCGVDLTGAFT